LLLDSERSYSCYYVVLHWFNVCLRDNHCPSQTGHRAHATQTQTGPSLLQPKPTDRNGLALETGNSSGKQRAGVKARARAPPSRRGENARCSKHTGWQASMHAKHDGKDAKQGKAVKESEKARKKGPCNSDANGPIPVAAEASRQEWDALASLTAKAPFVRSRFIRAARRRYSLAA
jgi:hypothetical protein